MPDLAAVESFVAKWQPSIMAALEVMGEAVRRAGYETAAPFDDVDYRSPPRLVWAMPTWYPGRPEDLESMDMYLMFSLLPADQGDDLFVPVLELQNVEGSYADNIGLGEPLRLEDDRAMSAALAEMQSGANQVAAMIEAYFPKPAKRVWRIKVVEPGGAARHPSVTTNEEFAKAEVTGLLRLAVDRIRRLFWELETVRMHYAWNTGTTAAMSRIEMFLDDGEAWEALREYERMIRSLTPALRSRVTKAIGTLAVETTGGYS